MKKFLSVFMCVVLLASCFAVAGSAAEGDLVYGDVDGKGGITAADARLTLRASAGLETLDEDQTIAADVNGDGSVSAGDARLILRASAGLENSANFGINGSQVFMSGNYSMTAVTDLESGLQFVIAHTADSTYLEATMEIDMSDGSTNTGKPVRIGFLTVGEKVYWVLPDGKPTYLLIDSKVTENMGISADMFKELLPAGMSGMSGKTPDEMTTVTINGKNYNRWIYENEDGTSVAHDMRNITLQYIRTFDAAGNETAVLQVKSISPTVPEIQQKPVKGGMLYAAKPTDAEDDIGYITAFLLEFAALANIPTDDILGG